MLARAFGAASLLRNIANNAMVALNPILLITADGGADEDVDTCSILSAQAGSEIMNGTRFLNGVLK